MKRVLIVASDGLTKSGVPTTFVNIIRGLKDSFVFDVLYFDEKDAFYKDEINSLGGKAIYCPIDTFKTNKLKKLLTKFNYTKTIKRIISENGPYDIVHAFKGFESGYVLKAAKLLNVPIRIAHKTFIYNKTKNPIINFIEKMELKLTVKYSTLNIADSLKSLQNPGDFSKNGIVLKTYVDDSIYKFSKLSPDQEPIAFIQIGSYSVNKNQLFSLRVFEKILRDFPHSKLHFVGFDNSDKNFYFNQMCAEIKNKQLSDHVQFYNFDTNVPVLFKKCNFLLFPSHYESFGIVPVEAQMSGLCCFCSDTITEESNCGGNYYLPLDVDTWVAKIKEVFLLGNGQHIKFDCSEFSRQRIISKYLKIYSGE